MFGDFHGTVETLLIPKVWDLEPSPFFFLFPAMKILKRINYIYTFLSKTLSCFELLFHNQQIEKS